MSEVLADMDDTNIKPVTPSDEEPGAPADKQMLVRCTESEKKLWKKAADINGETLAGYVRRVLTDDAEKTITCQHPKHRVKFYPWGNPNFYCLDCKKRINMEQIGL